MNCLFWIMLHSIGVAVTIDTTGGQHTTMLTNAVLVGDIMATVTVTYVSSTWHW